MNANRKIILLHVLYWLMSAADLMFISNYFAQSGPNRYYLHNSLGIHPLLYHLISYLPLTLLSAGFFYCHLLIFIPAFFSRKKYLLYSIGALGTIGLLYLPARYCLEHYYFMLIGGTGLRYTRLTFWVSDSSAYALRICFIAVSYYLTLRWVLSEKERGLLKRENLTRELALLKSEINHHFLFNTLGNIHSLTYTKSDRAPQAVLMLSDIMRYMLYDSRAEKVLVSEEVAYITNYVELQKLKMQPGMPIEVLIRVEDADACISPFILIPYIENVFTHGCFTDPNCTTYIEISQQGNEVCLKTINGKKREPFKKPAGIGMKNTKRRLELLYPGRHEVLIRETDMFILQVKLYL